MTVVELETLGRLGRRCVQTCSIDIHPSQIKRAGAFSRKDSRLLQIWSRVLTFHMLRQVVSVTFFKH